MIQPFSIIDLVAIIPIGALRSLRMFRFLRLARLLRVLKLARFSTGFSGYLKEIKKRSFEFMTLGGVVFGILILAAIAIFTIEKQVNNDINTFNDALWWSVVTLATVGYGDVYPHTLAGKFVAALLMLTSIGIVGGIGGMITSTIMTRIDILREGRIDNIPFENHIVFCGWTPCAEKVAKFLAKEGVLDKRRLVVLTENEIPSEDYLLACKGDFSKPENLMRVNVDKSVFTVIFHETSENVDRMMADMKATLTVMQIESLNPDVYTITEVFNEENAKLITGQIKGDEIVFKELVDADLILNTIRNPGHTSELFYEISSLTGNRITVSSISRFFSEEEIPVTVKKLKRKLIDESEPVIFLGYMHEEDQNIVLNPPNRVEINGDYYLYFVERKK